MVPFGDVLPETDTKARVTQSAYLKQHQYFNPYQQHLEFQSGLPSKYYSGPTLLNFSVCIIIIGVSNISSKNFALSP